MPTQNTTIAEGLEDCEAVRISYSTAATPNAPFLTDDDGRYLLVERTEPTQALKIVLQYTPSTDPYDFFFGSTVGTITTESFDGFTQEIYTSVQPSTTSAVGQGRYTRYEDVTDSSSDPDGGSSSGTNRFVYSEQIQTNYDDDWNPIQVVVETFAFTMPLSSQGQTPVQANNGQLMLNSSSTNSGHSLFTPDFRSINFETGAVSDGWAIVVYEVYEWGDSELARFRFDVDPQATARCNDQRCDNGCIEIVRPSDGAWGCICFDPPARPPALGPPRPAPDLPLPVHPKQEIHQKRAPLKQARQKLAKAEADYRETLDDIGQEEQAVSDAVSQGDTTAETIAKNKLEELTNKGSEQASDYQSLKLENEKKSAIEKNLVEAEKTSDTTVVPIIEKPINTGFTQGTRYPTINRGTTIRPIIVGTTIKPTINRGTTIRPTIIGTTIRPTIIGTTIRPTVNTGITIKPTINGFKTSNALRGSGISVN